MSQFSLFQDKEKNMYKNTVVTIPTGRGSGNGHNRERTTVKQTHPEYRHPGSRDETELGLLRAPWIIGPPFMHPKSLPTMSNVGDVGR